MHGPDGNLAAGYKQWYGDGDGQREGRPIGLDQKAMQYWERCVIWVSE